MIRYYLLDFLDLLGSVGKFVWYKFIAGHTFGVMDFSRPGRPDHRIYATKKHLPRFVQDPEYVQVETPNGRPLFCRKDELLKFQAFCQRTGLKYPKVLK